MRLIVKIGGAQLSEATGRAALAAAVRSAREAGHEVILVHGGGDQIRRLSERLGLPSQYQGGLRVTDAETAEVALQVLGGEVNRKLVQSLEAAGVPAVGLTGADGSTFDVLRHRPGGVDLGFVGEVHAVRPALTLHLLAGGYVPVLATVAPLHAEARRADPQSAPDLFYNVNADMGAGPLTHALGADALLFLTGTDGVLDADGATIPELTPADCERLERTGVIHTGMLPKVRVALAALTACPAAHVAIVPADGPDPIRAGLARERGTHFHAINPATNPAMNGSGPPAAEPTAPPPRRGPRQETSMDEHMLRVYKRAEEVFVSGTSATLVDESGKEYVDFLGGIAVSALGHGHPALVAALRDQAGRVLHTSNLYRHPYTEQVAEKLAEFTGLEAAFFCNSGSEAVEGALKLSRKLHVARGETGRTGFVALEHSFHGRTLGALSVTHKPAYREPFAPLIPGVTFVPGDDEQALAAAVNARPAALILEPIQGEAGVRELSASFLRRARELCDATGTVLIHDEVQCGSGRTGRFLAGDWAGVKPDIVTLAKPLAAGLPIGAMVVRKELAEVLQPGDHGSTFGGGPFVLRAALVFLEQLEGGLLGRVRVRGEQLRDALQSLRGDFDIVLETRGRGLIQGLRLAEGYAPKLQQELYRTGMLANATGDVVRFLPPYVITEAELERGLTLLERGLHSLT